MLVEAVVPNAPGSYVGISKLSSTSVRISTKDNSDNENGFYALVYDYATSSLVKSKQLPASHSSYIYTNITGLVCDKIYSANIFAFNADGNSSISDTRHFNIHGTFSTICPLLPAAPGPYIGITPIDKTSVRVNFFDNADNEDGFLVFDESGDINVTLPENNATNSSETYVTLTGLTCDRIYVIKALAFNNDGNSAMSTARDFNIHTTFEVPCIDTPVIDTIKPVITLLGDAIVTLTVGDIYTDVGATAIDNMDGNISANIQITSNVNTNAEGNYTVTYVVSDTAGNVADMVSRTVIVNPVNIRCDETTAITREALIEKIGNGEDVTEVNTCMITDMSHLFNGAEWGSYPEAQRATVKNFNQDISGWNTSSVTNMIGMFYNAVAFNQPLDSWNVSSVKNMHDMFEGAVSFNQPLNSWNVSSVTNMRGMFESAVAFNQVLDEWNVSNVTDMHDMFEAVVAFNKPLNSWDVSNVTDMSSMFEGATTFNQDISNWDVFNVGDHEDFAVDSALEDAHNPFY